MLPTQTQSRIHTVSGDAWRHNKSWQWSTTARHTLRLDAVDQRLVVWYQPHGDDQAYPVYEGEDVAEVRRIMRYLLGVPSRHELPLYIDVVLVGLARADPRT